MSEEANTIKSLNKLIQYLYDSKEGYLECARISTVGNYKNLFTKMSSDREEMLHKLKDISQSLGNKDEVKSGTTSGLLHRFYLDLKTLFGTQEESSIRDEIKRGENFLLYEYNDILSKSFLPDSVRATLERQKNTVIKTIEHINNLPW